METYDLFRAFKIAIDREAEANAYCLEMAQHIEDPELKKLILDFADHEERHRESLAETTQG